MVSSQRSRSLWPIKHKLGSMNISAQWLSFLFVLSHTFLFSSLTRFFTFDSFIYKCMRDIYSPACFSSPSRAASSPECQLLKQVTRGPWGLPMDPTLRRATDTTAVQLSEMVSLPVLIKHSVTTPLITQWVSGWETCAVLDWIKKTTLPNIVYENNILVSENDLEKLPLAPLHHFRPLHLWLSALSALEEMKLISFFLTSSFVGFFLCLRFHPKSRRAAVCLHRQCSCTLQLSVCV